MTADSLHDLELPHEILLLSVGGSLLHGFDRHQTRRALVTAQIVRLGLPDLQERSKSSIRSFEIVQLLRNRLGDRVQRDSGALNRSRFARIEEKSFFLLLT